MQLNLRQADTLGTRHMCPLTGAGAFQLKTRDDVAVDV